jgi:hypothetical protein
VRRTGLDPVWWTRSEGRIRWPEWDQADRDDARGGSSRTSSRPALPARLCRSGGRCTVRVHAFLRPPPPRWAFSSLGPCPHQGSFPKKSGCHDHIPPSLRTTCRTAAASPRTIPRNAGAQINQAAGHAVIWGGTLGVRRDAQGARDGELSVPRRRWPVCAIDHILRNEPTATACAW